MTNELLPEEVTNAVELAEFRRHEIMALMGCPEGTPSEATAEQVDIRPIEGSARDEGPEEGRTNPTVFHLDPAHDEEAQAWFAANPRWWEVTQD